MKNITKILLIAIAFVIVGIGAYLLGRSRPSTDLQTEIAGLKTIVVSQEQTIARMDSTIRSYDTAITEFVGTFDQFRVDNKLQLERMDRNARNGMEFHKNQLEKLAEIERRRNALMEEAKIFEY